MTSIFPHRRFPRLLAGLFVVTGSFLAVTWAQESPVTRPARSAALATRPTLNRPAPPRSTTQRGTNGQPFLREPLHQLKGHTSGVLSIDFSPDSKFFVSSSADRTAKLWNADTGALVRTFTGHKGWVFSSAFSTDGKKLVTAGRDGVARVWEVANGNLLAQLKYQDTDYVAIIMAAQFVNKDTQIVTTGNMGVIVWDWDNEKKLREIPGPKGFPQHLAVSADEKHILLGTDVTGQVRNFQNGALEWQQDGFQGTGVRVSFLDSDKSIRFFDGNSAKIFNLESHELIKEFRGNFFLLAPDRCLGPNFSGVSGLAIADTAMPQAPLALTTALSPIQIVGFSPDGHYFVAADNIYGEDPQPIMDVPMAIWDLRQMLADADQFAVDFAARRAAAATNPAFRRGLVTPGRRGGATQPGARRGTVAPATQP